MPLVRGEVLCLGKSLRRERMSLAEDLRSRESGEDWGGALGDGLTQLAQNRCSHVIGSMP
jgi:hypothetical protein